MITTLKILKLLNNFPLDNKRISSGKLQSTTTTTTAAIIENWSINGEQIKKKEHDKSGKAISNHCESNRILSKLKKNALETEDEKTRWKWKEKTKHTPKLITSTRNLQTGSCDYKSYTTGGFCFIANNNEKKKKMAKYIKVNPCQHVRIYIHI